MGLGPPVCLDCRRVQEFLPKEEREQLEKENEGVKICSWWCSKCRGYNFVNEKGYSDSTMNDSHLFEHGKEERKEFRKNK